uniref:HAT C-terminal dimerisation domain-containing protein n=1 Tax=Amphimedon queenslandica TaxID=400682 RepID=A0A1X7SNH6_AMPQE
MLIAECEELGTISNSESTEPSSKRPRVEGDNGEETEESSLLWSYCDIIMDKVAQEECDSVEDISAIVEAYLNEANEPRKSNPLLYWKKHKDTRPILASLALRYLTCPASTVASERLFSAAGNILTDSQNRLSPDCNRRS